MNRGIKVLQTSALPLGYVAVLRENLSQKRKLAIRNGLEPSTSSVTGWHSNQLNYRTALVNLLQIYIYCGGRYRARTYDPLLVRQMLSQLS